MLRRTVLLSAMGFICWMIWLAVKANSPEMADALVWALVVLLMLPMTRFDTAGLLKMIDTWRNPKPKGDE